MIRGVNRQIIEINDTQNKYFEKAIFFVRHDLNAAAQPKLHAEALKLVEQTGSPPVTALKRKRYRISRRLLWLMLILVSCAAAIMAYRLLTL